MAIILVYEYIAVAESRRTSNKLNWLNLMNNSINDEIIQEKFNTANINIDKHTLKLLPIVLKALNQNRYVEKIIEEPTSLYPPYETRGTTDITYTKNIFADTRNWMKMPNSRLYTIEYKTSPIVYFKNPTRNVDYFTKIRKIRDYQRILNYVDKMINERNSIGSTLPMNDHTENPIKLTTPIKKYKASRQKITQKSSTSETLTRQKKLNCKCPHKIGELMNKLLVNIQKLLSYFSVYNIKEAHQCRPPIKTIQPKSSMDTLTSTTQKIIENQNDFEPEVTTDSFYKKFLNRHKYIVDFTNTFNIQSDRTLNAIKNFRKPIFNKKNPFAEKYPSNEDFSTTNSYVMPSETSVLVKETSTESFPKYIVNIKAPANVVTTVADYILQKGIYDVTSESKSTLGDNDFVEDDDDYTEITANHASDFNKLDVHSLELVKNKIISERINDSTERSLTYQFKGAKRNQKIYTNIGSMRKLGNLITNDNNKTTISSILHRFAPILKTISKPTAPKVGLSTRDSELLINFNISSQAKEKSLAAKNRSQKVNVPLIIHNATKLQKDNNKSIASGVDYGKVLRDSISEEALKHMEEAIQVLTNETTNHVKNFTTILDDTNQWKLVKLEENITSPKSIMPNSKSTYLEMQRSDWRYGENHDYDNYSFD